jgi:carbon storage regulator
MLVFSRRKGQRIVIANEIEIIVTHTSRGSVKLAVRAPARFSVLRGEVFDAIAEANRAAAGLELPAAEASPPADEADAASDADTAESESESEPAPRASARTASVSTL